MLESVCLAVLLFTYLLRFSARRHCDCKQATHLSIQPQWTAGLNLLAIQKKIVYAIYSAWPQFLAHFILCRLGLAQLAFVLHRFHCISVRTPSTSYSLLA